MTVPEFVDLSLTALAWSEADQVSYAELISPDQKKLYVDLDTLDAVELLRLAKHTPGNDRVFQVLVDLLLTNGYVPEALFLSISPRGELTCRLLYQKKNLPGFLELRPGDGLVLAVLMNLPVRAHTSLLMSFVDRDRTTVG